MVFGERQRKRATALALILAGLIALLVAVVTPAAPGSPPPIAWQYCEATNDCRPVDVSSLTLAGHIHELRTVYTASARSAAPLVVHVTGMASAELWWNGTLAGRNGVVANDRDTERPGLFDATMPVPPELIRSGPNLVVLRLSAQHLWAPVVRPIHWLSIGPYAPAPASLFVHYLPTLIVLGMLLAGFLGNGVIWALHRTVGDAVMTALAGTVMLQAGIETSKLALAYPYPWQLARLSALAGLATLAALLVTIAALCWVGERRIRISILLAVLLGSLGAWLLFPWWDAKALWAFRVGIGGALAAAAIGTAAGRRPAILAGLGCVATLGFSGMPGFLDIGYYLLFTALFAARVLFSVWKVRRAAHIPAPTPTSSLTTDLILVPNGGAKQRVLLDDLLYVRAADDYCVLHLCDGRELLATLNLAAFLRLAPARLLRAHRSHAINPDKVYVLHRAGRFARTVELAGGTRLSVGRTYWSAVLVRLAPPNAVSSD